VVELVAYDGNRDYEIDEPNALSVGTLGMLGINAAVIGERDYYAIRHAEHLTADSNLRSMLEFVAVSLRREIISQARSPQGKSQMLQQLLPPSNSTRKACLLQTISTVPQRT